MNKIFKVIWSKSKQCYVVVSEMAKNTTGKKKIIVASILAGLAMSTMGPNVMAVSSIPFTDKPSSALGNGSVKPGTTNGVAIGNAAYSDSHQSIAIGFRSLASGTFLGGSIKPSVAAHMLKAIIQLLSVLLQRIELPMVFHWGMKVR